MKHFPPGAMVRVAHDGRIVALEDPKNPFWYRVEYPDGTRAVVNISRLTWLADQVKEIKQSMFEVDEVERNRIKQLGTVYDAMDAEAAAQTLQDMVDTGKLDMAVKILASMKERQAARVLATLPSSSVAVQMLDRLKGLKAPTQKAP